MLGALYWVLKQVTSINLTCKLHHFSSMSYGVNNNTLHVSCTLNINTGRPHGASETGFADNTNLLEPQRQVDIWVPVAMVSLA